MAKHSRKRRIQPQTAVVLAFVITLVLCGGLFAAWFLWNAPNSNDTPASDSISTKEAQDVALLLILTDNDSPHFVCLYTDAARGNVSAVALPPQTARTKTDDSLEMLFADKGAAACADEVGVLLNIHTPWVAEMSYESVEQFIDRLPHGLVYDLTEKVSHQTDTSFLRLEPGLQTLTGGQAVKLLQYPKWKQGALQQVKMHAVLVETWWNQYATRAYVPAMEDDYAQWYRLVRTNFNIAAFTDSKEVLSDLWKSNSGKQCTATLPNGQFVGSGENRRFLLK